MAEHSATPSGATQSPGAIPLPQDFETALSQLEALVARMESGELPLEQSLAAYERGVELSRVCQRLLDAADEQVKVLQGNVLKPFDDATNQEG